MRRIIPAILFIVLTTGYASANMCAKAEKPGLYVVMPGGALRAVVGTTEGAKVHNPAGDPTFLRRGVTNFVYKTPPTVIPNSLVVIHQKIKSEGPPLEKVKPVDLNRAQITFGCRRADRPIVPAWGKDNTEPQTIAYDKYDNFNRYGTTEQSQANILRRFHVDYHNGNSCVASDLIGRRAQFVFRNPGNIGVIGDLFSHLSLGVTPAIADAATLRDYKVLRVDVHNYKTRVGDNACVTFSAAANGTALELSLSEVERNAGWFGAIVSGIETWNFQTPAPQSRRRR